MGAGLPLAFLDPEPGLEANMKGALTRRRVDLAPTQSGDSHQHSRIKTCQCWGGLSPGASSRRASASPWDALAGTESNKPHRPGFVNTQRRGGLGVDCRCAARPGHVEGHQRTGTPQARAATEGNIEFGGAGNGASGESTATACCVHTNALPTEVVTSPLGSPADSAGNDAQVDP